MLNLHRPSSLRIVATTAVLFVFGALVTPFVAPASAAVASTSFQQCANSNTAPHNCSWINGDVQASNSVYSEGMSLPQRLMLSSITATAGNVHTLKFTTQWTKAGKHAYDWITSYAQAQAAATYYGIPYTSLNECTGAPAGCSTLRSGAFIDVVVPDDAYVSHDGATQSRINAYETQFSNRTVRLWGSSLSSASLALSHGIADNADTGDSDITWTLTWTGSSDVLLEFAAHIARATGTAGWGTATGAASISGSPYHVSLASLDNSSLGAQDNQMKSNVLPGTASLKVIKSLSPNTDPGTFDLKIDGTTKVSGVTDGGNTGFVPVAAGSHTVSEVAHTGTTLSNYTASTSCDNGTTSSSGSATMTLAEGEIVTCTITNTRNTGTIQVVKHLSPTNDPGKFDLLVDGTTQATDQTHNGQTSVITVNTGTHTVGETAGTGTSMSGYSSSVACVNGASSVTATSTTGGWSVPVTTGAHVVCTITNTRQTGTITVNKVFSPTTDPGLVDLSVDGTTRATDQGNGGTTGAISVPTGTNHSVGESAGTGTSLSNYNSSISCTDGTTGSGTSLSGITVTSTGNVTCTITNTRKTGTLQVMKALVPTTDAGLFDLSVDTTTQATDVSNGQGTAVLTLPTGSHGFAEAAGTGTSLSDYSATVDCRDARGGAVTASPANVGWTVNLTDGLSVVCTITNTRKTGTIQVIKATVPTNDPGLFDLLVDGTTRKTDASNGQGTLVLTVPTGTHGFAEAAGTGTDLTQYSSSASCVDGRTAATVTAVTGGWTVPVGDGSSVVCTITNTHLTGTLSITKSVVGGTPPPGGFTFNVSCTLGSWSLTTSLTFMGSGTQSVSGILSGASCTATETAVGGWTASPTSATTVVNANATSTLSFTNSRDTGTLQIAKHAVGHSTSAATFTFDVSCSDSTGLTAAFNGVTVTTDATTGDGLSSVLSGIASGSTCTVTERPTAGWRDDSGARSTTVAAGQLATVSFNNTQLYTDVALVKGVDVDGDGPDDDGALVQPGSALVYSLTYTNTGNTDAVGVVISDQLPANSTFDSIADGGTFDASSGLAAWIVDIPAGGSGTVHWTVTAQLPTSAGQVIDNVATFVAPDNSGGSNPVSNPLPFGDLTLFKAVSPTGSVQYGATLTYSLTATATGSLDQHDVVITDVVPTGTSYVAGSATCTGTPCTATYNASSDTVTWAVGDLAAGASRVVSFRVTVDTPPAAADGSIPSSVIHNSGVVGSVETPDTPSNQVDTPVTTVLGVKVTRKPPVKVLPFTGIPMTQGVAWALGMVLLGAAVMAGGRRPRTTRKH